MPKERVGIFLPTSKPSVSKPSVSKPSVSKPSVSKPSVNKPSAAIPNKIIMRIPNLKTVLLEHPTYENYLKAFTDAKTSHTDTTHITFIQEITKDIFHRHLIGKYKTVEFFGKMLLSISTTTGININEMIMVDCLGTGHGGHQKISNADNVSLNQIAKVSSIMCAVRARGIGYDHTLASAFEVFMELVKKAEPLSRAEKERYRNVCKNNFEKTSNSIKTQMNDILQTDVPHIQTIIIISTNMREDAKKKKLKKYLNDKGYNTLGLEDNLNYKDFISLVKKKIQDKYDNLHFALTNAEESAKCTGAMMRRSVSDDKMEQHANMQLLISDTRIFANCYLMFSITQDFCSFYPAQALILKILLESIQDLFETIALRMDDSNVIRSLSYYETTIEEKGNLTYLAKKCYPYALFKNEPGYKPNVDGFSVLLLNVLSQKINGKNITLTSVFDNNMLNPAKVLIVVGKVVNNIIVGTYMTHSCRVHDTSIVLEQNSQGGKKTIKSRKKYKKTRNRAKTRGRK